MKFFLAFLITFTARAEFQDITKVGTSDNLYYDESVCISLHSQCVEVTVNPEYAKLATQEVDDLEKPIIEIVDEPCEGEINLVSNCPREVLLGYEKKTVYITEIDGAKKIAYDAKIAMQREEAFGALKMQFGHKIINMINGSNGNRLLTEAEKEFRDTHIVPITNALLSGGVVDAYPLIVALPTTGLVSPLQKSIVIGMFQEFAQANNITLQ